MNEIAEKTLDLVTAKLRLALFEEGARAAFELGVPSDALESFLVGFYRGRGDLWLREGKPSP